MEEQSNPTNEQKQKREDSNAESESKFSIEERNNNYPLLATNKIQPSNKINTIMVILLCVGIVSLLSGGVYLYMLKKGQNIPKSNTSPSHNNMVPPGISGDVNGSMQSIDLVALSPFTGTASASRMLEEGKYTLSISLSTSLTSEGKYYEGWINNNSLNPSYISVGRLERAGDRYILEYTSSTDYMDYSTVYITEQSESPSSDIRLGAHMFQGNF